MDKCQGMRTDSMKDGKCYAAQVYNDYKHRQNTKVKLTPPDLYYPLRGAIVSIYAITQLNGSQANIIGSGFFIASDRVLTAASVVLYNGVGTDRIPATDSPIVKANSYKVRVQNVKSKGDSFFYDARLTFVSPSFDIAMLEVIPPLDKCTPSISPHPILEWGCSRDLAIGEAVYTIGDYLNMQTIGIAGGTVVDNVYNDTRLGPDYGGKFNDNYWGFEGVLTDIAIAPENIGGPLLNAYGRVVGVIAGSDFYGEVTFPGTGPTDALTLAQSNLVRCVAVSQHVAEFVTDIFLAGPADRCTGGHLELIRDTTGNFYRFVYGYLGINAYETNNPDYMQYVPNLRYQKQQGILVLGVEVGSPLGGTLTVPSPFPNIWTSGPVTPTNEMYLITSMNGNPIGVGEGQVCLTTVTRLHIANDGVEIHYRLGSEGFGKSHALQVQFQEFPQSMDYPPNFLQNTPIARGIQKDGVPVSATRGLGIPNGALQAFLKQGEALLKMLKESADVNKDGKVDVADAVQLLSDVLIKTTPQ